MVAIPQMLSLPSLAGVTLGTFDWPALGAVLAWFVVLAFLASVVGILREYQAAPAAPAERTTGSSPRPIRPLHFPARHVTREAA